MSFAYAKKAAAAAVDNNPADWPKGWAFPTADGPWPPGWPLATGADPISGAGALTVVVTLPDTITIGSPATVQAETQEDAASSSLLDNHLLKVTAAIGSTAVNVKKTAGGTFASAIYYQVGNYTGSQYGISESVYFDLDDPDDDAATVTVTVTVVSLEAATAGTDTMTVQAFGEIALLSSASLTTARTVLVSGDYAYVSAGTTLAVVDISDPLAPSVVGSVTNANINDSSSIAKVGTNIFIATNLNKLVKVSVATPSSPSFTTSVTITSSGGTLHVASAGSDLAVAGWDTTAGINAAALEFFVYDTSLSRVSSLSIATGGSSDDSGIGVAVSDDVNTAYVTTRTAVLHAIDISTPSAPSVLGTLANAAFDEAEALVFESARSKVHLGLHGTVSELEYGLVDVTNPASMTLDGSINSVHVGHSSVGAGVAFFNLNAYIAGSTKIVRIDTSTPSSPSEADTAAHTMGVEATAIDVTDDGAHAVLVGSGKLSIIRL